MRLVVECVEQKNNPEVYQYLLAEKEKIQIQINEKLRSRNLEDFPILQQIQEHIAKIFVDFFGSQAFTNLIKTHLLEITRQVVREVIME
jgi:predicted house-cleaning noncanonical NTP pyrophosphatase (MazG superfamily)